jgi:tetratricopeptide (TPR) repeat protein
MDPARPTPARCTRCGAPVPVVAGPPGVDEAPGAPPAFGGSASSVGSTSGATLYGMPDDSLEAPIGLDEDSGPLPSTRLARGAASGGRSSDRIGIPRDDDDDMLSNEAFMSNVDVPGIGSDSYNELDLPLPGDDLELDLPDVARGRTPTPVFAPPRAGGAPPTASRAPAGAAPRSSAPIAAPPAGAPRSPQPTAARAPSGPLGAPRAPLPGAPTVSLPRAGGDVGVPPRAAAPSAPSAAPRPVGPPPAPRAPIGGPPPGRSLGVPTPPPPPRPPGAPRPTASMAGVSATDLPTPVERATAMTFKVPTVDLLTPTRPSSAPFRAPEPPPFQPSNSSSGSLPLVADFSSDAAMISVADLDLPAPVEMDLPTPAGVVDLPTPVGLDLPTPVDAGQLRPTDGGQLAPADHGVQPAHNLPGPSDQNVQPVAARKGSPFQIGLDPGGASANDGTAVGLEPGSRRSPAPRSVESGNRRRPLWLALSGLALIGTLAGGAYAMGIFDPPIDDTALNAGRGAPKAKPGDGKQPIAPASKASERSAAVLALLARDTPSGYVEAITAAEQAGDPVGQAEAALLIHLRYGPDPARQAQATTWLEPYAQQADPFVRRVLGLVALGSGALEQADTTLVGDDSRTRLYRGWLRLRQARTTDAISEAEAVLALKPDDTGALVLRHAGRAALDPTGELAAIEASLATHPGHPGLLAVGVRAATAAGELRRAGTWLEAVTAGEGGGKGYDATKLRMRAELEVATGALPSAAHHYEEAIAISPDDRELALARVRVLMAAGRVADADTTIRKLVAAKPDDIDALLLQAEVHVAAGKGDEALTEVQAIEKAAPGRARTSYLLGLVYSMRSQTEEGRTAFAAAIARDPAMLDAKLAEARVLADGAKLGDAIALLDAARKQAAERGSKHDEATILRHKAEMLAKAGQRAAADAALDQALIADPRDNAAALARGLAKLEQGDFAAGRTDLLALYERTGAIAGLTAPLGRIFVREGSIAELDTLVGGALADPDVLPEVLLVGARLRLAQGKPDEAKGLLQRVLDGNPNDWEANLLLAQAMVDTEDYAAALVQIDRSTPALPSAEKHLLRGKILEHNDKHADARPEYLKALQIDPSLIEARFLYGRLLAYAGESRAAVDELAKVVAEASDKYPEAWLNLGRAQRELAETADAVTSLEKALALDPELFEAHYLLGRARYEQNEMTKSIAAMQQAIDERAEASKWYPDAWVFLARAQAKNGQKKAAVTSFKKFLEVAPPTHPSRSDAERQIQALR